MSLILHTVIKIGMRNTDDLDTQMSAIKFEGWLGLGPDSAKGKMQWGSFEPKAWTENDIDIQISIPLRNLWV